MDTDNMLKGLVDKASSMEKQLLAEYHDDFMKLAINPELKDKSSMFIEMANKCMAARNRKVAYNPTIADVKDNLKMVDFLTKCADICEEYESYLEDEEMEDDPIYMKTITVNGKLAVQIVCFMQDHDKEDAEELINMDYMPVERDALLHTYAEEYGNIDDVADKQEEDDLDKLIKSIAKSIKFEEKVDDTKVNDDKPTVKSVDITYNDGDLKVATTGMDDKEHGKLERLVTAFLGLDMEEDEKQALADDYRSKFESMQLPLSFQMLKKYLS